MTDREIWLRGNFFLLQEDICLGVNWRSALSEASFLHVK